jgi:addiction module RelB/DinJ family antitoxin
MSVQVSTRIDETTKKQFDDICEHIGISPSNAISMLIKGVINYNGIPFKITAQPEEIKAVRPPFEFGCMAGKVWMADDFDAPMEEFEEYM